MVKRLLLSASFFFVASGLSAQGGFELVSEEDIKEYYEKPLFVPDARISGDYELISHTQNAGFVQGEGLDSYSRQKFTLNIRSEVNKDVHLFVGFTNRPYLIGNGRGSYFSHNETDRRAGADSNDNNLAVIVDQAYLAYYSNPCALFKIGLQEISPGDRNGMVYRGKNTALVNECTIGTWPYELGMAVLGPDDDSIKWVQLTYPVYNNGKFNRHRTLDAHETEQGGFKESGLDVELFRINVSTFNTAFSNRNPVTWSPNNGKTYNFFDVSADNPLSDYYDAHSPYHSKYDAERYLYADYDMEYYGINVNWYYYSYALLFNAVVRNGNVEYSAGKKEDTYTTGKAGEVLGSSDLSGKAYRLQNRFFISNHSQLILDAFYSDGNKTPDATTDASTDYLENALTNYGEINPGTFENHGGTFFNAYNGVGEGHSISNLTYYGLVYKYASTGATFRFAFSAYRYLRSKPILNAVAKKVDDIGTELGLHFNYYLKSNLNIYNQTVYFSKGNAYVKGDFELPPEEAADKEFTYLNFGIKYTF